MFSFVLNYAGNKVLRSFRLITSDVGQAWLGSPKDPRGSVGLFLFGDREQARIASDPPASDESGIFQFETARLRVNGTGLPVVAGAAKWGVSLCRLIGVNS
jgi:hypothetical protein